MITLRNLSFGYQPHQPVLDGIDLEILPGCIYGLLGKNGEGKTTLLKLWSGLLFPDKGECRVNRENPALRTVALLQQLFFLPEEISLPDVTAGEYFNMYAPFYPGFRPDILQASLDAFEVDRSARLQSLSLGQKKKVAITLALAAHTRVLLMDEPTNGLDIPSKTIFRQLLSTYLDEEQTVVISTHQVRDLESLIDTVVILHQKRVLLNKALAVIAQRLFFRPISPGEKVLYAESTPYGQVGVGENTAGEETPVSLELLFNAAIGHPEEIMSIFSEKNKGYESTF